MLLCVKKIKFGLSDLQNGQAENWKCCLKFKQAVFVDLASLKRNAVLLLRPDCPFHTEQAMWFSRERLGWRSVNGQRGRPGTNPRPPAPPEHIYCASHVLTTSFPSSSSRSFQRTENRPGNFVICPISVSPGPRHAVPGREGPLSRRAAQGASPPRDPGAPAAARHSPRCTGIWRGPSSPKGCILEVAIRLFTQVGHFMTPTYEVDPCSKCSRSRESRTRTSMESSGPGAEGDQSVDGGADAPGGDQGRGSDGNCWPGHEVSCCCMR